MLKNRLCTIGALSLLVSASGALSAIIPVPLGFTPEGDNFRWSYSASIGDDLRVNPGDFFTIYDFGNLLGDPEMPAGWTYASAALGKNPIFVAANDDPGTPNVTFQYTGTTELVGPLELGTFSVLSQSDLPGLADFAAQATHDGGTQDGQFVSNHGTIEVPETIPNLTVPEPSSAAILLAGGGLFLSRRRKSICRT